MKRFAVILLFAVTQPASAINIVFDYTYDGGFFSGANIGRRVTLEAAAAVYEQRLISSLPAIVPNPGAGNTWSLSVPRPDTGVVTNFANLTVAEDTLIIYAGGRDLGSVGGMGYTGFSYFASSSDWYNMWQSRASSTAFLPPGGSVSFNTTSDFYFDPDPTTLEPFSEYTDFYTLALHEIGHVIGFFLGEVGDTYRVGDTWVGPNAMALNGGPVPLIPGENHIQDGFLFEGLPVIMDPTFGGQRIEVSELEWAILQDMGWEVAAVPEPSTVGLLAAGIGAAIWARRRQARHRP